MPPPLVPQTIPNNGSAVPSAAPAEVAPAPSSPSEATPSSQTRPLPEAKLLADMLPSLQKFLPAHLYEPLERRPNDRHLQQVRDHLSALLETTKTYLPYPVVAAPQPGGVPTGGMYEGVFLFGDVSGFTPLSEKLKKFGQAGAERITEIINSLFSELVRVLFDHGGTLLKFGGDALLGLFPASTPEEMRAAAIKATQAGLAMQDCLRQEKFAQIEAAGEVSSLKIKCGISSGRYFAAHIGTPQIMAYVTTGHTVNDAEHAEGHAEPGDVVMTQAAYDLVQDLIQVGGVNKEPDPSFHRVLSVPPVDGTIAPLSIVEPPAGEVMAQITYLVDRMDHLSPYLNSELIARIVSNPGNPQIAPDHRQVTVMFINYVGISDLIADMGESQPELITQQLNNYFVHMANVVERYEGTVARMDQYAVGDRLVVFFGAPRAHEDDPIRAIYTALDMQKAVKKNFAALQTAQGIYRFRQRIGINTGTLFAGNVGATDLRQEYTLMGDDINMAARLMSKSGWDEVFITKRTQERVAPFFDLKDRGELKVKGKEILIPTFEVLGRRGQAGRRLEAYRTPLIGRDDSTKELQACGARLLGGRGQIVSIIGEGGLGKTRMIYELQDWLQGQAGGDKVRQIYGQALSFGEQMSYWLAGQIFRSALGLKPDASEDDTLFALWERCGALFGKETAREAVPFLAHMMNLELEGEWANWVKDLDPKVRQKQIFWAARELLMAEARQQPLIIVLDDLHWGDEASVTLIEHLLEVAVQAPLMFLFVFRPLREKRSWQLHGKSSSTFHHRYTVIELDVLDEANSRELLNQLLPGIEAEISDMVVKGILDKTAGNPFYIQEVVRSMTDGGAVVQDAAGKWHITDQIDKLSIPDTLQGAILARIDRLSEDARQALQMAAVIGRRFQKLVLHNITKAEDELSAWISQLESNDLIHPMDQQESYLFLDALVQEVTYENLLVQRRQAFHRQIGEALEEILGDRLNDPSDDLTLDLDGDGLPEQAIDLLAYHFKLSDAHQKAIRYLDLAGQKAQHGFANETALEHYTALLALLGDQEDTWEHRYATYARRQQLYGLLGRQQARENDLEMMMLLAQSHQDKAKRADTLNELADLYQWTSRYEDSKKAAQEALDTGRTLGDMSGQAKALHQLGVLNYVGGNLSEARPLLEQAVTLRQALHDGEGEGWSQMYLGMVNFVQGNYSDAMLFHQKALEAAQSRQDAFQSGIHLTNSARVGLRLGSYEQALEEFQRGLEMKVRVGDRVGQGFNLYGMGQIHNAQGHYEEAIACLNQSIEIRQEVNDERGLGYCYQELGMVEVGRGNFAAAENYFRQSQEINSKLKLKGELIENLSWLARCYQELGDLEKAAEHSQEAMKLLHEQKTVPGEIQRIHLNHALILEALGKEKEAQKYLKQAYEALMTQANKISNPYQQEVFLKQVPVNREVMARMAPAGEALPS
jgi:class 3 adenylate cyclase/predicted ATPase